MIQGVLHSIQPNFPQGKLPGVPEFSSVYYNMSQGSEPPVRGAWNEGGDWKFVEDPQPAWMVGMDWRPWGYRRKTWMCSKPWPRARHRTRVRIRPPAPILDRGKRRRFEVVFEAGWGRALGQIRPCDPLGLACLWQRLMSTSPNMSCPKSCTSGKTTYAISRPLNHSPLRHHPPHHEPIKQCGTPCNQPA